MTSEKKLCKYCNKLRTVFDYHNPEKCWECKREDEYNKIVEDAEKCWECKREYNKIVEDAKNEVVDLVDVVNFLLVVIALLLILVLFSLLLSKNSGVDCEANISNSINESLVRGYRVGYEDSQRGVLALINYSFFSCDLIKANISGVEMNLITTNCIK
jgi:hypothetical protein